MKWIAFGLLAAGAGMFVWYALTRVLACLIIGLILDTCGAVLLVNLQRIRRI